MSDLNTTIGRAPRTSRAAWPTGSDRRMRAALDRYATRMKTAGFAAMVPPPGGPKMPHELWRGWPGSYWVDSVQRSVLFWDTLRQRGNNWLEHEDAGKPPLLHFEWEMIVDARTFERPVNYALVRIIPPQRRSRSTTTRRPFVIIDPRAGHGPASADSSRTRRSASPSRPGIRSISSIFFPDPEPGQTLADVMRRGSEFVARSSPTGIPKPAKPVMVGNCQGGWATMMLAAAHPGHRRARS